MDAVNQSYMTTVAMVKQYRRPQQTVTSKRSITVPINVDINDVRESAAVMIQSLVRMHQAQYRWGACARAFCSRSHKTYPSVGYWGCCSPNGASLFQVLFPA